MQNHNFNELMSLSTSLNKTTYQGKKRCFGEFECHGCRKTWKSANSHSNEPQICSNCKRQVFPLKQKSLQSMFDNLRKNNKEKRMALIESEMRFQHVKSEQRLQKIQVNMWSQQCNGAKVNYWPN